MEHEWGIYKVGNLPTERWGYKNNYPVTSPTRLMGAEERYRGSVARMLREIEHETGSVIGQVKGN